MTWAKGEISNSGRELWAVDIYPLSGQHQKHNFELSFEKQGTIKMLACFQRGSYFDGEDNQELLQIYDLAIKKIFVEEKKIGLQSFRIHGHSFCSLKNNS